MRWDDRGFRHDGPRGDRDGSHSIILVPLSNLQTTLTGRFCSDRCIEPRLGGRGLQWEGWREGAVGWF